MVSQRKCMSALNFDQLILKFAVNFNKAATQVENTIERPKI